MSNQNHAISNDEIYLRVTAPMFFEDLIGAHTATLVERADPEAFASWKQIRLVRETAFAAISSEHLVEVDRQRQEKSFEAQSLDFAAALARFGAESEIPLERHNLSPRQAGELYVNILREEWGQERVPAGMSFVPERNDGSDTVSQEDLRFVVNREIDASKVKHIQQTDPALNTFKGMSAAARDEFLKEQRAIGQEVLTAQEQSFQQVEVRRTDPSDRNR